MNTQLITINQPSAIPARIASWTTPVLFSGSEVRIPVKMNTDSGGM